MTEMVRFERGDVGAAQDSWPQWRKVALTRARRIEGPFQTVTREGTLTCEDGYLAVDPDGYPYPIERSVFEDIYEPA